MMSFLALHHIAAQRGDGLRPELVKLLERSRAITEAEPASPAITESEDVVATRFPVDLTQGDADTSLQDVIRIPTERKWPTPHAGLSHGIGTFFRQI
jgi:hypothetical protein